MTITRDSKSYEEFFMIIYTGAGYESYQPKHFSNCINNTFKVEFEVVYNFLFRSRMVNQLSNFTINVHQDFSKVKQKGEPWYVIVGIIINFTIIFALSIFITIIWYKILQIRYGFTCCYIKRILRIRKRYISRCLKNMKTDKFQCIKVKFNQNNCIICFEDFEPSSEVWITNKWSHVFHHACLKQWFNNVRVTRDLSCPVCNTIITDISEYTNNDLEHESNEVNASIQFITPSQIMHTNNVTWISCTENNLIQATSRTSKDKCITSDNVLGMELNKVSNEEIKLSF